MKRLIGFLMTGLLLLAGSATALAGNWTVVTVEKMPDQARIGEPLRIGMVLRQHGETLVHEYGGMEIQPLFEATNKETGDKIEAEATREEKVGYFSVEVTFPSAGTWFWTIDPRPFGGKTEPMPLEVVAADSAAERAPVVAEAPASEPETAVSKPDLAASQPETVEVAGVTERRSSDLRLFLAGAGILMLGAAAMPWLRRRVGQR